ncbi:MAG: DUF3179 domain-containing protein [Pyrinomonadaceae bacterium]|nr:DUF3179 domain-containing protein [Pyrinomonadaceae bacterium]
MINGNSRTFPSRRAAWLTLVVIAVATLAVVLCPVWIIHPFRPQSQRGLELSFAMRRWSPLLTLIAAAAALVLVVWLWRSSRRWWRKAILVVLLVPVFAAAWFARQNHFEWMFNPLDNAAYAKTSEAGFVADNDIVMAIEIKEEAAAYPVRLMAYHHIVQDIVGGIPIVATY